MLFGFMSKISVFEAGMLICFGASWPFAVYKTYKSKNVEGKSLKFLLLVLLGYIFGIIHKILYNFDAIIFLYLLNSLLVFADIVLYFRYKDWSKILKKEN